MRINADMINGDIEAAMNWLACLIGAPLDRSVANIEQHGMSNPLLASYFQEKFAFRDCARQSPKVFEEHWQFAFRPRI
jgi:hypothetical protein